MPIDTTIPLPDNLSAKTGKKSIPLPDFLFEKNTIVDRQRRGMPKHSADYHEFCKWAALPEELRNPKTQAEFERKHGLVPFQTSKWKQKQDFYGLRMKYFWDWMMDQFPDVVHAIVRRAKNRSSSDAKIFTELISKKLELDRPRLQMTPIFMIGVQQKEIDQFIVPEEYDDVVEKTVKEIENSSK